MFTFKYKNYGICEISMYDNSSLEVASVMYTVCDSTLHIEDIQKTTYADKIYGKKFHFGSAIFNELLKHLKKNSYTITKIIGTLSIFDAYSNWESSIPFYYDFPNYIDPTLNFKLIFHIYNNKYYDEVVFPINSIERNKHIKLFISKHLLLQTDAYFCYDVL